MKRMFKKLKSESLIEETGFYLLLCLNLRLQVFNDDGFKVLHSLFLWEKAKRGMSLLR